MLEHFEVAACSCVIIDRSPLFLASDGQSPEADTGPGLLASTKLQMSIADVSLFACNEHKVFLLTRIESASIDLDQSLLTAHCLHCSLIYMRQDTAVSVSLVPGCSTMR